MTLFINVIHNEEKERLEYLRPILSNFTISIPVKVAEISDQTLCRINVRALILRKATLQLMRIRWRRYVGIRPFYKNLNLLHEVSSILNILFSKKVSRVEKSRASIEDVLSKKHHAAIKKFCEEGKDGDYVLVLESDARIPSDKYLSGCIDHIRARESENTLYLLTFPFSINQLGVDQSDFNEVTLDEKIHLVYPKLFLNTTAAYLMTYDLARALLGEFEKPTNGLLKPADLLMNDYFRNVWKKFPDTKTFVFIPSPIENGSLTGAYPSTI